MRLSKISDYIFPPVCELCGCGLTDGRSLCEECISRLARISHPFCDTCGEAFEGQIDGEFECQNCKGVSFHFEYALAALKRSPDSFELVHRLKYGKQIHLAAELASLAAEVFKDSRFAVAKEQGWALVPVPLHRGRENERHFNQAAEIARVLGELTGLPRIHLLKRVIATETQTRLSRKERMDNLKHAFAIRKPWFWQKQPSPSELPGVILVDDVFTTGSTVDACAKVLRKAGVRRVAVLTVLRG